MISRRNRYELFETNWLMMSQNPGGKSPYLQGHLLGFVGTINILEAIDAINKTGTIKIKIGNGDVQEQLVDFSGSTPASLTPSVAVTALNSAGFTGCVFSVDSETGRLKLSPNDASIIWVQIYGDLAAALHFGDCRFNEGKGCYILPSFDGDLKSVAETEQWDEDTTIENDSPLGVPVKYTVPGKRSGTQIVVTDRLSLWAAKQMINGGRWISGTENTPDIYEPPASANSRPGRVDVFTYSVVFDKMSNVEGDEAFVRERMYIGCIGRQTRTGGAGTNFKDSEYTLTAADYVGDNGKDYASPRETDFTRVQWDALGMNDILVKDWENA